MDFYYIRHSIFNFLFVTHYINKWLISSKFFSLLTYHSTTPGPSELLSSLCVCHVCYHPFYFPHINLFYVRNGINLWAFFNIMFTFPLFTYLTKIRHLNIFHIHMKFKVLLSFGFTPLKKIQNFTQSWKIYLLI
jgi:hypothetical protein